MGIYVGAGGVKTVNSLYVGAGGVKTVTAVYVGAGGTYKVWPDYSYDVLYDKDEDNYLGWYGDGYYGVVDSDGLSNVYTSSYKSQYGPEFYTTYTYDVADINNLGSECYMDIYVPGSNKTEIMIYLYFIYDINGNGNYVRSNVGNSNGTPWVKIYIGKAESQGVSTHDTTRHYSYGGILGGRDFTNYATCYSNYGAPKLMLYIVDTDEDDEGYCRMGYYSVQKIWIA